jgi:hypothetical protein
MNPGSPFNPRRLLLILAISLLVFLLIEQTGWLDFKRSQQGMDTATRVDDIQLLLRVIFLPLLPVGAYVVYLGYMIIRSGRFPPPGSRLLKELPPQSGALASIRGWFALVMGLCLCGLAVYGAVIVPRDIARLINIQ